MSDDKDKPDTEGALAKLKTMISETVNEVLDERETKAAEAKEEKEKEDKEPESKRTDNKPTFFETIFGG